MTQRVDLSNLREAIGNDKALEKELFDEFIVSSKELLEDLREHCRGASDNETWRKSAHALKGISYNLGAVPMAELCKRGQENFESSVEEKLQLFEKIQSEHSHILQYLSKEAQ